jgi:glucokinase
VAVPGFADGGVIRSSPNFPQWRDVPFGTLLAEEAGCLVHLENDASAAAWGAYLQRGSREDLVLLTLGTGVGGGVVSGGRLIRGASGCAAEIGHMYVGGDRLCGCGARGCLETWISTGGLIAGASSRGRTVRDGRAVLEGAAAGEDWARAVCAEAGEALGRGLRNVVNLLNPDVVLIAGGLSAGREHFEPSLRSALESGTVGPALSRLELVWQGRAEALAIVGVADLGSRSRVGG